MLPKKVSIHSMECCKPLGWSTESRSRTATNNEVNNSTTRTSMAKLLEIGVGECLGCIPSANSKESTGPPKRRFSSAVNQSCSIDLRSQQEPCYKCLKV